MEVGTETVLLGQFGQALVLNPTAGLVWRFLDGETALGDLIDDFSDVLDVDLDTVRTTSSTSPGPSAAPGCSRASPSRSTPPTSSRSSGHRRNRSPSARCSSRSPSPTWTAPRPPWRRGRAGGSCSSTGARVAGSA